MFLELPSGYGESQTGILFGQQELSKSEFPWASIIWRGHTDRTRPDVLEYVAGEHWFLNKSELGVATLDGDGNLSIAGDFEIGGNLDLLGTVDGRDLAVDGAKLDLIEAEATADQTDAEIETAYNNRVPVVVQLVAEQGTSTTPYRWTPERIKQAIEALQHDLSGDIAIGGNLDVGLTLDVGGAANIGALSLGVGEDTMLAVKGDSIAVDDPLLILESQDVTYEAGIEMRVPGQTSVILKSETNGSAVLSAMEAGADLKLDAEDRVYIRTNDPLDVLTTAAIFESGRILLNPPLDLGKQASTYSPGLTPGVGHLYYYGTGLWFRDEDGNATDLLAGGGGTYDRASGVLSGASVFSDIVVADGLVTNISTRNLTAANIGAAAASHNHDSNYLPKSMAAYTLMMRNAGTTGDGAAVKISGLGSVYPLTGSLLGENGLGELQKYAVSSFLLKTEYDITGASDQDIMAYDSGTASWASRSPGHRFGAAHPSANLDAIGRIDSFRAGATITAGYAVALLADLSRPEIRHLDADSLMFPVGIALNSATAGSFVDVLTYGVVKLTGTHYTVGSGQHAFGSVSAGYISPTKPTLTGDFVYVLGYGLATDVLFVNPQANWVENG